MPFICRYHIMFQHDNAGTHVARICTQFLKMSQLYYDLHTPMLWEVVLDGQ